MNLIKKNIKEEKEESKEESNINNELNKRIDINLTEFPIKMKKEYESYFLIIKKIYIKNEYIVIIKFKINLRTN